MLPKEIEGKYAFRSKLGSGAMGRVYEAVDRIIERRVAIKVVDRPAGGDPEAEESHTRFRREAQAAGRLSHPNIVGVYDYGEDDGQAWIIMELVEGGSLKDRLDRQERFGIPAIVSLMVQVLGALAYSHARGVVHRDIKPANIMLSEGPDGTPQVKLADFGIARLENSSMTQVGTLMGTPSYMAPEQLRGETVDERADIWAAGVVLYQLLTGEKPFEGSFSAVLHKALHIEPPPPSRLSVTTPRAFDAVVAKAMAKRPEDRFPSAAAFAQAIRDAAQTPAFPAAGAPPEPSVEATLVAPAPLRPVAAVPPPRRPAAGLIASGAAAVTLLGIGASLLLSPGGDDGSARQEALRVEAERQSRAAAEAIRRSEVREPATPPEQAALPAPLPRQPEAQPVAPPPALPQQAAPAQAEPAPPAAAPEPPREPSPEQRRQQLQAAAAAAIVAEPCSLLRASETAAGMVIAGPIRRGGEAAVRDVLLARGAPEQAFQLQFQVFDGPFCGLLATLRRHVATEAAAPEVSVIGTLPLQKDELLRLSLAMPAAPSQLSMSYVTVGGEVGHMIQGRPEPANARLRLGDPVGNFPGWAVDEPYGTDLLLVFASDQPVFPERRPAVESLATYGAALEERLRLLNAQGRRVGVRALVVETVARR